ncbi:MAG: hypothetical protein JRC58_06885 [Deltaproteobacteria bacterium]|jgi:hypothetical protein|nr:hypothetical protein [Deltaproteobacteria bacterium]
MGVRIDINIDDDKVEDIHQGDCVEVADTNPAEGPEAVGEECPADEKIYCPGIGIVQD